MNPVTYATNPMTYQTIACVRVAGQWLQKVTSLVFRIPAESSDVEKLSSVFVLRPVCVERGQCRQQSSINQESLQPWLTSANSSSLTSNSITDHNMAAMFFVLKNRQVSGWAKRGQRSGRAVCTSSNLLVT
ncbi:hypothetical protein PoB_002932700 [Plakobranchus ocellatus]|uniref:Uncharacterized protein n=1 Tax=Plakobranchus ocellatus TaxID=259542 RepID=A0AAV4A7D5_9GAST|nr:hypothetical protein PoB_002932700 [Plakobranchus ocellatus]